MKICYLPYLRDYYAGKAFADINVYGCDPKLHVKTINVKYRSLHNFPDSPHKNSSVLSKIFSCTRENILVYS
jgi:hypothetical protein